MAYAKQESDPTTSLTSATQATAGSTVAWHGYDLQIDGTTVEDLQSATLSLSDLARFQYGLDSIPNRGVTASPTASLDVTATFVEETRLDLAKGGQDTTSDTLASVSGQVTLTPASGSTLRTYSLSALKPNGHTWSNVIDTADATDSVTFTVNGEPAVEIA